MPSIKNWWAGEINWTTPAGQLLQKFLATLPANRPFHLTFMVTRRCNVTLTVPHPTDILIGKLDRLDAKDLKVFERTVRLAGHPTAEEFKHELQNVVDLFRHAFDGDSPIRYPENTRKLWRKIFHVEIDVRLDIIEPAIAQRRQGCGESPPDYTNSLDQ
jgi:hypothetical protein